MAQPSFSTGYQPEPYLTYHRVSAAGELVQTEVIEIPRPVMMHDFAITEHYAIFFDLPIVFALEHGGFKFDRSAGARIGVMPRTGSNADVRWFEVEPCTVFHAMNSYEIDDTIVVHVCRAASIMEGGMDDLSDQSTLWQWTINLSTGVVTERQLDDLQLRRTFARGRFHHRGRLNDDGRRRRVVRL